MASRLERKWWFIGITALLASMTTRYVMEWAGVPALQNAAQWILYTTCFIGMQRFLSLLGWGLVLFAAPQNPDLKPG